jgi:hypothetical protein
VIRESLPSTRKAKGKGKLVKIFSDDEEKMEVVTSRIRRATMKVKGKGKVMGRVKTVETESEFEHSDKGEDGASSGSEEEAERVRPKRGKSRQGINQDEADTEEDELSDDSEDEESAKKVKAGGVKKPKVKTPRKGAAIPANTLKAMKKMTRVSCIAPPALRTRH